MQLADFPSFVKGIRTEQGHLVLDVLLGGHTRELHLVYAAATGTDGKPGHWWKIRCGCQDLGWLGSISRDAVGAAYANGVGRTGRPSTWRRIVRLLRFVSSLTRSNVPDWIYRRFARSQPPGWASRPRARRRAS